MPLGPVIASQGRRPYSRGMAAFLLRLAALVAVALMPVGMATAPAAAQPAPSGHCSGHEEPEEAPATQMDAGCLGCVALPAAPEPGPAERLVPAVPRLLTLAEGFGGIEPEIATPPPKSV